MPPKAKVTELENRFLSELSETLDIDKTIEKLNITREDARAVLKGLIKEPERDLFGGLAEKKAPRARYKTGAYAIYVDGASRGNPGKAGAGAVIKDPEGRIVKKLKKYLGITTNNAAEYQAIITALEAAKELGLESIKVYADSELMVKQINGVYKVRSEDLRPLFDRAKLLLKSFKEHKVTHIYREENSIADSLANEAIDTRDLN